jgi:hypothetical protein
MQGRIYFVEGVMSASKGYFLQRVFGKTARLIKIFVGAKASRIPDILTGIFFS